MPSVVATVQDIAHNSLSLNVDDNLCTFLVEMDQNLLKAEHYPGISL